MSTHRRSTCKQCGRPDREAGRMSKRGLCRQCADDNQRAQITAVRDRNGPTYEEWLRRYRAAIDKYMAEQDDVLDMRYRQAELQHAAAQAAARQANT